MKYISPIVLAVLTASPSFAQQPHKVPFASLGNTIELTVENASAQKVEEVRVVARDIPSWIHVTQTEQMLDQLKPKKEKNVTFAFAVDKTAPVNKEQRLSFVISTPSGEVWTKEITISVAPPERFELFQNYPNPFNPQTSIEYILPKSERVKLVVYDVLGREVQTLVDGVQDAGYRSVVFDATNLPSGVYFYRLQAGNSIDLRKMLVAK